MATLAALSLAASGCDRGVDLLPDVIGHAAGRLDPFWLSVLSRPYGQLAIGVRSSEKNCLMSSEKSFSLKSTLALLL